MFPFPLPFTKKEFPGLLGEEPGILITRQCRRRCESCGNRNIPVYNLRMVSCCDYYNGVPRVSEVIYNINQQMWPSG